MNKLYITKVLPDGYGVGVIPETKSPVPDYSIAAAHWEEDLKPLPTFLIHPSCNPKEGGWIEQWREGFETVGFHGDWHECSKSRYDSGIDDCRRIVLLPLVEKKIDVGAMNRKFERMTGIYNARQENEYHLPITPPEGNTTASEQGDGNRCLKMKNGGTQCSELCEGCWQLYCNPDSTFQSPPSLQEREKGMKNEQAHPEDFCQKCKGENPNWTADSELFNTVNGSPNGIICPNCFIKKANEKGVIVFINTKKKFLNPEEMPEFKESIDNMSKVTKNIVDGQT